MTVFETNCTSNWYSILGMLFTVVWRACVN